MAVMADLELQMPNQKTRTDGSSRFHKHPNPNYHSDPSRLTNQAKVRVAFLTHRAAFVFRASIEAATSEVDEETEKLLSDAISEESAYATPKSSFGRESLNSGISSPRNPQVTAENHGFNNDHAASSPEIQPLPILVPETNEVDKKPESLTKESISDDFYNVDGQFAVPNSTSGRDSLDLEGQLLSHSNGERFKEHNPQNGFFRVVRRMILSRSLFKAFLKWASIILNVGIEAYQAYLTQEDGMGKIQHEKYLMISIITSSICLIISLLEASHECATTKVCWCCSSCGSSQRLLLEKFLLCLGMTCSMVQLIFTLIAKFDKDVIHIDCVPLFLAIGHLIVAMILTYRKKTIIVRCKTHGDCQVKPRNIDGKLVYQCCQCQIVGVDWTLAV